MVKTNEEISRSADRQKEIRLIYRSGLRDSGQDIPVGEEKVVGQRQDVVEVNKDTTGTSLAYANT